MINALPGLLPRHLAGLFLVWGAALTLPACSAAPQEAGGSASASGANPGGTAPANPADSARSTENAASSAPANGCNAAIVQNLVGQHGSSLIAEGARQKAGARRVRLIGHDEMVTKEYDRSRLNLQLDAQGRIAQVYCG